MKILIAPVLFILAAFPKEIYSVFCCGKPAVRESPVDAIGDPITISPNVAGGNPHTPANQLKVGLDTSREYVIGFAELGERGLYYLHPFFGTLPAFNGELIYIKLKKLNDNTAYESSSVSDDERHILDAYHKVIHISLIHWAIQHRAPRVSHPRISQGQTSPSVRASPLHGQTSAHGVQAIHSHVQTTAPSSPPSPSSAYYNSMSFSHVNQRIEPR